MTDKKFGVKMTDEEKEVWLRAMPMIMKPIMFTEEQKKAIHNAAGIAARSTNFDVELFEKELYENLSSHDPQGNVFKKRNLKKIDDPIKHPSEISFPSGGVVSPEVLKKINMGDEK
jgi:hypothetical protein